jgi:hypothetical protein
MTVAEALRLLLESKGIGVAGETLFLSDQNIPEDDETIYYNIHQTGGRFEIETHEDSGSIPEPFFQLTARHGRHIESLRAMEEAWEKLVKPKIANEVVGDKFFLWIRPSTPPFELPPDPSQRRRVAFNIATCVTGAANPVTP